MGLLLRTLFLSPPFHFSFVFLLYIFFINHSLALPQSCPITHTIRQLGVTLSIYTSLLFFFPSFTHCIYFKYFIKLKKKHIKLPMFYKTTSQIPTRATTDFPIPYTQPEPDTKLLIPILHFFFLFIYFLKIIITQ